jgi:hypothetical protein
LKRAPQGARFFWRAYISICIGRRSKEILDNRDSVIPA